MNWLFLGLSLAFMFFYFVGVSMGRESERNKKDQQ